MNIYITSALLLSLSITSFASDKAIYGLDSRTDVNDSKKSSVKTLSKSIAAMIPKDMSTTVSGRTAFLNMNLSEKSNVCRGDRFSHQQAVSNCTGFLVSPTHLVTAGHCIKDMTDCRKNFWVFDYKLGTEKSSNVGWIANTEIYNCKRIVQSKLTVITSQDWAVIELDRAVKNRKPLGLSTRGPSKNTDLMVIGTPSGTPLKVATGKVRSSHFNFFRTNLDTFGGNSGSPVFNVKTNLVEGILVRGDSDYKPHANGSCSTSSYFKDNSGLGESVSYIKAVRNLLKLN